MQRDDSAIQTVQDEELKRANVQTVQRECVKCGKSFLSTSVWDSFCIDCYLRVEEEVKEVEIKAEDE